MTQNNVLPNHKNKIYGGAWSVYDQQVIELLDKIKHKKGNLDQFLEDYKNWIGINLDEYPYINFSAGTTETFDKFYHKHSGKRLRLFKGEYFYHQIMARNYFQMEWLENDDIKKNDFVIISCPFSDTGDIPQNFYSILQKCEELNVPVLIDMAYINISNIKHINLNFSCIKTITTSLSKVFPVEHHRIGIRFDRDFFDDTLNAYNQNNYVNLYSVHIGHSLIKNYKNSWLYEKYKDKQKEICEELDINTSPCVIFGIDVKNNYKEYNRGSLTNRLCFSKIWSKRVIY